MIAAALLAVVFHIERASPSCDGPYTEIAAVEEYQPPDLDRYVDEYIDTTIQLPAIYCYQVSSACDVQWTTAGNPDQMFVRWARLMPEINGLRFTSKTAVAWDIYDRGQHGFEAPSSITYELATGPLGNWTISAPTTGIPWTEPFRNVGTSTNVWFLVRGVNACGGGPWGMP